MALIGRFIGVDKYTNIKIRDLVGAKNDATALWALFTDSLSDIQSQLLTGPDATAEAIRDTFGNSLKNATPEDSVILFYSGHGSHDHRLAAYDTSFTDFLNGLINDNLSDSG